MFGEVVLERLSRDRSLEVNLGSGSAVSLTADAVAVLMVIVSRYRQ